MEEVLGLSIHISKANEKENLLAKGQYEITWLWGVYRVVKPSVPRGVINMYEEVYTPDTLPIADGESATLGGALDEARAAASEWLMKDFEV